MDKETIEEKTESMAMERIIFFSDAVIAIAITLLVLDIQVPQATAGLTNAQLNRQVLDLWPKVMSYLVSFWVIAFNWIGHHRSFRYIIRYDRGLIFLNLVFLMFIAFLPFPTALLYEYPGRTISVVLYALVVSGIGLAMFFLWDHAIRAGLIISHLNPIQIRSIRHRTVITPIVFIFSVGIAFINGDLAMLSWIILTPILFFTRRKLPN